MIQKRRCFAFHHCELILSETPDGSVSYGDHDPLHINVNSKSSAEWRISARMAGCDGMYE
jgi:hypothetical protein